MKLKHCNMKKFIFSCIMLLSFLAVNAQNDKGKVDDMGRITLAAYVPPQIDQMPDAARNMLANKLNQIVTQNGLGGSAFNQRFIITANIVVLTKDVTPTAPPMQAFTLDITLYIGDGIDGTKFASYSGSVKGVGENETKAYISALKNLNTNNPDYKSFIESGKTKIIEYYNSKCDFIIKEAQTLASQNEFDAAIFKLTTVPEVCVDCFNKCMDAVAPIYQKKIDRECTLKLTEANNIWSANQDINGANSAAMVLSTIEPQAACFKDVVALTDKIAKRVKELDQRDWDFKLKVQQDGVDVRKAEISAARDVGVAYGNNQPKSVAYNIKGWW
jgi:hypothetical protein